MSTAIGPKAASTLTISKETRQMRRDAARADQLFAEGLARLQAEYKARLRRAAGLDEETETASAPIEQTA